MKKICLGNKLVSATDPELAFRLNDFRVYGVSLRELYEFYNVQYGSHVISKIKQ